MGRPTKPDAEKVTEVFSTCVNTTEAERLRGYYERHSFNFKNKSDFVKAALMAFIKHKPTLQAPNTSTIQTV